MDSLLFLRCWDATAHSRWISADPRECISMRVSNWDKGETSVRLFLSPEMVIRKYFPQVPVMWYLHSGFSTRTRTDVAASFKKDRLVTSSCLPIVPKFN